MDKKTKYIVVAAVLLAVIIGLWFILQKYAGPNNQPPEGLAVPPQGKAEVKTETQVAKELNGLRITMDDNNQSMSMTPGKTLIIMLGTDYNWTITSSNESVLGKDAATVTDARIQTVYKALKEGSAVLTASGACVSGKTCVAPTASFKYTVDVVVSDSVPIEDLIK